MVKKIRDVQPPSGFSRLVWRAPIWIYRLGLGGLIKSRMLLLRHKGRKSGLARENVLEIVNYDKEADTYYIAAGFGRKSDWFQNILHDPQVSIVIGRREKLVTAEPLPADASGQAMVDYAHRNPRAAKSLMRFCGYEVDGSDQDYFELGQVAIPFVALRPR